MELGNCYGFFPRYYFNVATRRCEYFIYGGCGGNQNNFQTLQECEKTSLTSIRLLCDVMGVGQLEDKRYRDDAEPVVLQPPHNDVARGDSKGTVLACMEKPKRMPISLKPSCDRRHLQPSIL
ncbi:kunitz-type serine protease inhibitor 6-like [Scylla paramamosain]|uniref:kunitz-type serine protease inhibitor 6-like n=1 Tax=Scylla paramamosain TaxID=85552 RepID=UPI0030839DF5